MIEAYVATCVCLSLPLLTRVMASSCGVQKERRSCDCLQLFPEDAPRLRKSKLATRVYTAGFVSIDLYIDIGTPTHVYIYMDGVVHIHSCIGVRRKIKRGCTVSLSFSPTLSLSLSLQSRKWHGYTSLSLVLFRSFAWKDLPSQNRSNARSGEGGDANCGSRPAPSHLPGHSSSSYDAIHAHNNSPAGGGGGGSGCFSSAMEHTSQNARNGKARRNVPPPLPPPTTSGNSHMSSGAVGGGVEGGGGGQVIWKRPHTKGGAGRGGAADVASGKSGGLDPEGGPSRQQTNHHNVRFPQQNRQEETARNLQPPQSFGPSSSYFTKTDGASTGERERERGDSSLLMRPLGKELPSGGRMTSEEGRRDSTNFPQQPDALLWCTYSTGVIRLNPTSSERSS